MNGEQPFGGGDFTQDPEYWSFSGRAERKFSHGFLQYPAMMVPQMQGEIIDLVRATSPEIRKIWDPFVGAGTSLGEAMLRGLDFAGNDINPLAVLVSKTKRGPLHTKALENKTLVLYTRIDSDRATKFEIDFPGRDKWFEPDAIIALSRIRRAIIAEPALWARRFFWVAMAECVRLTSNSRTSTYKLHIRKKNIPSQVRESVLQVFKRILDKNLAYSLAFKEHLDQLGYLTRGFYNGATQIELADSTKLKPGFLQDLPVDFVITSPPYGDNRTTVPYGQYSYLPLNWIELRDIDKNADPSIIKNTNTLDALSLGGSNESYQAKAAHLSAIYPEFCRVYRVLEKKPLDAQRKVASFVYDLDTCIDPILSRLNSGGFMAWTLGNRTVANVGIPLDTIFEQMMTTRGIELVRNFDRVIPSKRMASKNNISSTMKRESIIIARKV